MPHALLILAARSCAVVCHLFAQCDCLRSVHVHSVCPKTRPPWAAQLFLRGCAVECPSINREHHVHVAQGWGEFM